MDKKERQRIANKKYRQSAKGKLAKARADKKYSQTEKGKIADKKYNKKYVECNKEKVAKTKKEWSINNYDKVKISCWKNRGIITDDFDNIHSIYMNTTNCDYCKKEFMNSLDRCLDHDHSIKDNNNIRGILCRSCNVKDVLKGCPPIF